MQATLTSLRLVVATMLVCVVGYAGVILALGQLVTPDTANGSLIARDVTVIGSRLVAQRFERPEYFWPRPSAPDYDAAGAAGSNASPTSASLTERAAATVARYEATAHRPLPADLAAASGSGLDPHITERAARWQIARVAAARGLPAARVRALVEEQARYVAGPLGSDRIVNVLELDLALDALAE